MDTGQRLEHKRELQYAALSSRSAVGVAPPLGTNDRSTCSEEARKLLSTGSFKPVVTRNYVKILGVPDKYAE